MADIPIRPEIEGTTAKAVMESTNGWVACCPLDSYGAIGISYTVTLSGDPPRNPVDVRLFGGNAIDFADEIMLDEKLGQDDRCQMPDQVAALRFYRIKVKAATPNELHEITVRGVANPVSMV